MKFAAWIDYPSMAIAVQKNGEGYVCTKYVNGRIVKGASQRCEDLTELEVFLLSLPSAPVDQVNEVVVSLNGGV